MTDVERADKAMTPALIGIDWGSSNLRVALLDSHGALLDRRESPAGVFTVTDGDFASVLWPLCVDWVTQHRVPLLACGMIGSRQGIVDVPYVPCPADVNDLARALGRAELRPGSQYTLFIVPGLKTGSDAAGWDVVRGEETQLLGATVESGNLFVLPGTHSKWMTRGPGGRLESFQTYMTGELFDLLQRHSSLARVMSAPQWSPEAFGRGVSEAREGALENLLFRVRTAGLMERFPSSALADYLSGLLIGAEVKAGLRRFAATDTREPISVLGSAQLTQRYAIALASFGLPVRELAGDAVFSGLMSIARSAGLLVTPRAST